MKELSEAFQEVIERYPPEYRPLREQLTAGGAKPVDDAWHELHLELVALEILGCCNWVPPRRRKAVTQALTEALGRAQDNWSQVYQQLVNVADQRNGADLREQVRNARIYPPIELKGERPELEKLGNLILCRLSTVRKDLDEGEKPRTPILRSVARGLSRLPSGQVELATGGAIFDELADRLTRALQQEKATHIRGKSPAKALMALGLVLLLGGGGYYWSTRPVFSGAELLAQGRTHYQAQEFAQAVRAAESAVEKLKSEGAAAPDIHQAREFLSSAYYKDGQLFRAQEQLEILVKAYPNNSGYRKTLEQVRLELKKRSQG